MLLAPLIASAQFGGVDDFADNSVDMLRWTVLAPFGGGLLEESQEALRFNASGSGSQFQYYAWTDASYDQDFELYFRVANTTMPESITEFGGIGVEIYPAGSIMTRLNVRLGSYFVNNFGPSRDVLANLYNGSASIPTIPVQPATVFPKAAAIRVAFDSAAKVFTVYYDANPTDGVQWTQLSTFGVDGDSDGAINFDFGMSGGSQFDVFAYARTDNLTAEAGDLILDDFQAVQGNPAAPTAAITGVAAIVFSTQLGNSYTLMRSTDLTADPAFAAVDLVGGGGTYRIVPKGQGVSAVTGTGNQIYILDPNKITDETAFYTIVTQ